MRKAFLIGFEYVNGKKLPGIAVDLYYVYCFLKNSGWNDEEIKILTDIKKDDATEVLKVAILEKTVNSDILTFIEDCKEKNIYTLFKSHNHYNNFSSFFSSPFKEFSIFVYYSGHSKDGNLILPNNALISLENFRNMLLGREIVLIMDCCEGGIELPWILNDKFYRLRDEIIPNLFIKDKFICISSSLENENSITSRSGSFFTRSLFKILENSKKDLFSILHEVRKSLKTIKQTANISSSYPTLLFLPPFLYSLANLSISLHPCHILIDK